MARSLCCLFPILVVQAVHYGLEDEDPIVLPPDDGKPFAVQSPQGVLKPAPTRIPKEFFHHYGHLGDQELMSDELKKSRDPFIYFEWQIGYLDWSPAILLGTKGVDFGKQSCGDDGQIQDHPAIKQNDPLFDVGLDGLGKDAGFKFTQLELTSIPMSPANFGKSEVAKNMQEFFKKVSKPGAVIPGTSEKMRMAAKPPDTDMRDHFQVNLGFPIEKARTVLKRQTVLGKIWEKVEQYSQVKNDEYNALVTMAISMVNLFAKKTSGPYNDCARTKNHIYTWLIKTDLSKLVPHVEKKIGKEAMKKFPEDVLRISGVSGDAKTFPDGVDDYLTFPDMASNLFGTDPLPQNKEGICKLAKDMVAQTSKIDQQRKATHCTIRLPGGKAADLRPSAGGKWEFLRPASPGKWLHALLNGTNLWSDASDPLSRLSNNRMLWKSIQDWEPVYDGFVVIESRSGGIQDIAGIHSGKTIFGSGSAGDGMRREAKIVETWFSPDHGDDLDKTKAMIKGMTADVPSSMKDSDKSEDTGNGEDSDKSEDTGNGEDKGKDDEKDESKGKNEDKDDDGEKDKAEDKKDRENKLKKEADVSDSIKSTVDDLISKR